MCAACKVIINQQSRAIANSLETILAMKEVRDKIGEKEATKLRQRLADADVAAYDGTPGPAGGQAAIIADLVDLEVLNPQIWKILHNPHASKAKRKE